MCHWHILAPRRGCFSNHLPLRRVRIFASSACFYGIGNSIGISYSIKRKYHLPHRQVVFLMDLRGIEPLSESLFIEASPITVAVLTFPWQYAHRQAYCFSSFMIHLPGQSLPGKVSHIVDTRFLMCECIRADEQHLGC